MALPEIDQGKFNTDYIKSGQGFRLMVQANFPGTGVILKPWTASWNLYCCFSRDKQHFVSFVTKQSFLLTFESIIDSLFSVNNELLLILPPLVFFWKQLLGSFLVLHLLYNQSEVLVRSGQILHHQYDIIFLLLFLRSDANSTRNYCSKWCCEFSTVF